MEHAKGDDKLQKLARKRAQDLGLFLNEEGLGRRIPWKGTAEHWDEETYVHVNSEK